MEAELISCTPPGQSDQISGAATLLAQEVVEEPLVAEVVDAPLELADVSTEASDQLNRSCDGIIFVVESNESALLSELSSPTPKIHTSGIAESTSAKTPDIFLHNAHLPTCTDCLANPQEAAAFTKPSAQLTSARSVSKEDEESSPTEVPRVCATMSDPTLPSSQETVAAESVDSNGKSYPQACADPTFPSLPSSLQEVPSQPVLEPVRCFQEALRILAGTPTSESDLLRFELNLCGFTMGDAGAVQVAGLLETNTSITSLNLGSNRIGAEGAASLANCLKINTTLTHLSLRGNYIGNLGAASMAEALEHNSTLKSLNLNANGIFDVKRLSEALCNNDGLATLELASNGIGPHGLELLTKALENSGVQRLDVRGLNVRTCEQEQEALERIGTVVEKKRIRVILTVGWSGINGELVTCTTLGGREVAARPSADTLPALLKAATLELGVTDDQIKMLREDGALLCDFHGTRSLGSLLRCSAADLPAEVARRPLPRKTQDWVQEPKGLGAIGSSMQAAASFFNIPRGLRGGLSAQNAPQAKLKELPGGMIGCLQSSWLKSCHFGA